nr:MAG TPA_asm: hypothetical protein [Caudoviricetes sp.]
MLFSTSKSLDFRAFQRLRFLKLSILLKVTF